MNKYLSQLVQLCEFDKQLDGFKPKIEAAQEKLSKKSGEISGAKEQIETLNAEIAELKSQILSFLILTLIFYFFVIYYLQTNY